MKHGHLRPIDPTRSGWGFAFWPRPLDWLDWVGMIHALPTNQIPAYLIPSFDSGAGLKHKPGIGTPFSSLPPVKTIEAHLDLGPGRQVRPS